MTKFDPNKPVQFRNAPEKVRILATDLKNTYPIVIAATDGWGEEFTELRHADGRVRKSAETPYDLVNVPKKREGWANIYNMAQQSYSVLYPTREEADRNAVPGRVACVHIKYTNGEGL
jgi:hypothetical protein